jgi:NADPH:quinone reductase-like Zn-dependent oxidoreductase
MIALKAKCLIFREFGNPRDVLKMEYKTVEPPKENEIFVRMLARPINPSDLIPMTGAYAHRISLPGIPGYEGVGIVEDVGPFVSHNLIGKRVLPLRGEGTWQEYVKSPAAFAVPIPDSIDDFTAAQLYINPVTAWVICTEVLRLRPDQTLLVNACGSAIGHIFAQLSNILGFTLIAVTRNDAYTEDLLHLGATHVINTSREPLREAVWERTDGTGADAAIDSVGGLAGTELAFCVKPHGHFLTIGLLSGVQADWAKIANETKVKANIFHLRHWNHKVPIEKWHQTFQQLIQLINDQKLRLAKVHSRYALHDIKQAMESSSSSKGKVFLTN